jgi:hypothetical protein
LTIHQKGVTSLQHIRKKKWCWMLAALPAWTGHSAAPAGSWISHQQLQFTAALGPVSAAHLNGKSLPTADQTKHCESLCYTAAECPVLQHATKTTVRLLVTIYV